MDSALEQEREKRPRRDEVENKEVEIFKITAAPYALRVRRLAAEEKSQTYLVREPISDKRIKKSTIGKITEGNFSDSFQVYTLDQSKIGPLTEECRQAVIDRRKAIINKATKEITDMASQSVEFKDEFDWRK